MSNRSSWSSKTLVRNIPSLNWQHCSKQRSTNYERQFVVIMKHYARKTFHRQKLTSPKRQHANNTQRTTLTQKWKKAVQVQTTCSPPCMSSQRMSQLKTGMKLIPGIQRQRNKTFCEGCHEGRGRFCRALFLVLFALPTTLFIVMFWRSRSFTGLFCIHFLIDNSDSVSFALSFYYIPCLSLFPAALLEFLPWTAGA